MYGLTNVNRFFKLYANCIPVKGAARSVICDLQRGKFHFIPNDLFDILFNSTNSTIEEICTFYGLENKETIVDYFSFLIKEEYIFLCESEELVLFPKLDLSWDSPSVITNAIIDVGNDYQHDFIDIFNQLEELGCKAVQLRFFKNIYILELSNILISLQHSSIMSIELILPFMDDINENEFSTFLFKNLRIDLIIFYSSSKSTVVQHATPPVTLIFTNENINDESHCGNIAPKYFVLNIASFTEAQNHNSCLNRKISIDKYGSIKNCPSMDTSYGEASSAKLKDVINMKGFSDLWIINKDQVEICKDCEFRYICSDCRAYTSDNKAFSKPAKCSYNPYITVWE